MLHTGRGDEETTRSGLFFEALRVIEEMREADARSGRAGYFIRPRFAIYENVEGMFSSNKGRDFQTVLTEIARIAQPDCPDVPMPEGNGKWGKCGCIYDELGRWSIAWRLHDAQFWGPTYTAAGRVFKLGTPQRRRRIALVADFGGMCAPEVLLIRKGLHWYPSESEQEREAVTGSSGDGTEDTSRNHTVNG